MNLNQVQKIVSGIRLVGDPAIRIKSVTYDSRRVKKGSLFTAIKGFRFDGHDFINEAQKRGAAALIVEAQGDYDLPYIQVEDSRLALALLGAAFYDNPGEKLGLVGITGTNGKTTTSFMVEKILDASGEKPGLIGTVTNRFRDDESPGVLTTPESLDIQEYLAWINSRGATHAVMEVSSHALKLKRVAGLEFDVAIFTNLSPEHGEFHQTFEDYLHSKSLLFSNYLKRDGVGVINGDSEEAGFIARVCRGKVLTYSLRGQGELNGEIIRIDAAGLTLNVFWQGKSQEIKLKMTGSFNAYNALAAVGAGLSLGLELPALSSALEEIKGVPGRFELVSPEEDFAIVVDFAHSPDSLARVLQTARDITAGRLILVFGCGGERDRSKRPEMTRIASDLSDIVIMTSDNPRHEPLEQILDDMKKGLVKGVQAEIIPQRERAIGRGVELLEKGDLLLIAGKGHETGQDICGHLYPFNDRKVARQAIERLKRGDQNADDEC